LFCDKSRQKRTRGPAGPLDSPGTILRLRFGAARLRREIVAGFGFRYRRLDSDDFGFCCSALYHVTESMPNHWAVLDRLREAIA